MAKKFPTSFYLNRSRELMEYSPVFNKYARRKKLSPKEKAQITREFKKYQKLYDDNDGDLSQFTLIPQAIATKLKKAGRGKELLGGLNILKLNQRGGGKSTIASNGDIKTFYQRDSEKAGKTIRQGRVHTFARVSLKSYKNLDEDGAENFADYVVSRFNSEYKKRKIPKKDVEYRIWLSGGSLVEAGGYVALDWDLFLQEVRRFLENYLMRWIQEEEYSKLMGFSWYKRKK